MRMPTTPLILQKLVVRYVQRMAAHHVTQSTPSVRASVRLAEDQDVTQSTPSVRASVRLAEDQDVTQFAQQKMV